MLGKDKVYIFGGKQVENEYSSSNKVYMIDFSNSSYPIQRVSKHSFPKS